MKISLSQLHILIYVLATTTTLSMTASESVPPVFDGYVDAQLIKYREPNFRNGTNLALEERQAGIAFGAMTGVIVFSVVAVVVIGLLIAGLSEDITVSSNLLHLVLLVLTAIRHSVVSITLGTWSPTCVIITPHTTMLYATQNTASHSTGPRARIGIMYTTSWISQWEGR
jgi:hypothetical protein